MLEVKWAEDKFVCVGLDSDHTKIKVPSLSKGDTGSTVLAFNCGIVDATKDLVCAYKPNVAFYREIGIDSYIVLRETVRHIQRSAPDVPVILDAKEADIGNTNLGYIREAFGLFEVDAVTVNPYLGSEALQPFLDYADKGIIVLCRTSNPGAGEFQDLPVPNPRAGCDISKVGEDIVPVFAPQTVPFYQYVAHKVATSWNKNDNCVVVVGATYPSELAEVRNIVRDLPILIPGVGAQGGDVEATVKAGMDSRGKGMIINSSRGIIFASQGDDFAEAARRETRKLHELINKCRQ